MSNFTDTTQLSKASQLLLNISARLTIGSAVCFTEGLVASILLMLPAGISFYICNSIIGLFVWLGFLLYRDAKLGAEICDLCFWELAASCLQLVMFYLGHESAIFWYLYATISILKLIRIYLWHTSATQQHGWGTFGPMTLRHAKRTPQIDQVSAPSRLPSVLKEFCLILLAAIAVSFAIKLLPGWGRVAVMWIIPVSFEFLIGPRQLRMISDFVPAFHASTQREAELTAKLAEYEAKIERLQSTQNLPEDQNALIQAYAVLPTEKQQGLMEWAQLLSKNFGKSDK